jgi:DNA uptake protein ComE-like DNA-binding protein
MGWGPTERKLLIFLAVVLASILAWCSSRPGMQEPRPLPTLFVDANTAPPEVFGALPGLGPALSKRIVEAREQSPFRSFDDLDRRVKGIGPAKAAAIRPFLSFDSASVPQP